MEKKEFFSKLNLIDDQYKLEAEIPIEIPAEKKKCAARYGKKAVCKRMLYVVAAAALIIVTGKFISVYYSNTTYEASDDVQQDKKLEIGGSQNLGQLSIDAKSCGEYFSCLGLQSAEDITFIGVSRWESDPDEMNGVEQCGQITDKKQIEQIYNICLEGSWSDDGTMPDDDQSIAEEKYKLVFGTKDNIEILAVYDRGNGYLSFFDTDNRILFSEMQNQVLFSGIEAWIGD